MDNINEIILTLLEIAKNKYYKIKKNNKEYKAEKNKNCLNHYYNILKNNA